LVRSTTPLQPAPIVLAQLKALERHGSPEEQWRWKVRLVKGLYDRGLSIEDMRQLFRLIDWMIQLPAALQERFHEELRHFEEERRMPYLSSLERTALKQGLLEGIGMALEAKFGAAGKELLPKLQDVQDVEKLRSLVRASVTVKTLQEFKRLLR